MTRSENNAALPASLELTPKQVISNRAALAGLPAGTRIYITDLGGGYASTIAASTALSRLALVPVPHLAARRIASHDAFRQTLAALAGGAGVREALVVGGGVPRPAGPFAAAIDLLETGLFDAHGFTHLAIAGHPEGSPDVTEADLTHALSLKQALARRSDARFRIVTQFGFDVDRLIGWAQGLQASGIDLPVHAGVAGPATVATLLKYAGLCGVGASLGFLRRRAGALAALATSYSPDSFVEPLERWQAQIHDANIEQFHVFPFGGVENTISWLNARGSLAAADTFAKPVVTEVSA